MQARQQSTNLSNENENIKGLTATDRMNLMHGIMFDLCDYRNLAGFMSKLGYDQHDALYYLPMKDFLRFTKSKKAYNALVLLKRSGLRLIK